MNLRLSNEVGKSLAPCKRLAGWTGRRGEKMLVTTHLQKCAFSGTCPNCKLHADGLFKHSASGGNDQVTKIWPERERPGSSAPPPPDTLALLPFTRASARSVHRKLAAVIRAARSSGRDAASQRAAAPQARLE